MFPRPGHHGSLLRHHLHVSSEALHCWAVKWLTHHMSSPQELLAQIHEFSHTMPTIPDKLMKLESDKRYSFWSIET